MAADGTELAFIEGTSLSDTDYFYVQNMTVQPDGSLLLMTGEAIMGVDAQGKVLFKEPMQENAWINNIVQTGSGALVAMVNSYNPTTYESKEALMRIDPATGTMTETGELPMSNIYNIMGGPGDTLILQASSALHTYDLNTGATSEMLNWLNSDMNSNRLGNIAPLPDGRLLVMEYGKDYEGSRLAFMEKLDDVVEKYVISFASVYLDDNLQDAIISFNKQNDTYRIQYLDYSQYNTQDNYSAGVEKLNYDIISGQIPDIFSMDGLPYDVYASKGLLDDLSKRMESDADFDKSKYLESVFEATSVSGKVYSLIPAFSLVTVIGRSENVGDAPGWTMEALQALRQRFPEAQVFESMERAGVLSTVCNMTMDSFVDPDTGACSFNTPAFIQLLEFIKTFPETIDWDKIYSEAGEDYWANYEEQYRQNRTLLSMQYFYNYTQMKDVDNTFGGPVTLVGFPVPEGVGNAIQPQMEVAVSSRSKLGAVCWDFVKYLLSEEYQSTIRWGFPVCKDCLQRMQDEAMKPIENGGYYPGGRVYASPASLAVAAGELPAEEEVAVDDAAEDAVEEPADTETKDVDVGTEDIAIPVPEPTTMPGDEDYTDYWSRPLTQDQADRLNAALRSADTISREHKEVSAIIEEEAGAFFSGQKSAAAVADIIQSRVSIYEAESR